MFGNVFMADCEVLQEFDISPPAANAYSTNDCNVLVVDNIPSENGSDHIALVYQTHQLRLVCSCVRVESFNVSVIQGTYT